MSSKMKHQDCRGTGFTAFRHFDGTPETEACDCYIAGICPQCAEILSSDEGCEACGWLASKGEAKALALFEMEENNESGEDNELTVDDAPPLFSPPSEPKVLGRFKKCMARQYHFDGRTMSLDEHLRRRLPESKSSHTREYSRRKRAGCYVRLAHPVVEYTVWWGDVGMDIPKIVWDSLNLPRRK